MESASVTEFFEILNLLPFWALAFPAALLGALALDAVGDDNGKEGEPVHRKTVAQSTILVLASMLLGVIASGYAHDDQKLGLWASLAVAFTVGILGVFIVMAIKTIGKAFARRPESFLRKYWPFKWSPWEGKDKNNDNTP
ncbi:hypothetical protein [Larkinella terrae]|uniref:Uncharacterized protein n=1 Tax=Larkinella terrae TaxID=2025311 RepID=A0A7K0EIY8_9BACT|nr:hypothetical protein [Larkinella terrae]MRS61813.1 hypothetical protein [Larkinella terrae]